MHSTELIDKLNLEKSLSKTEWTQLIADNTEETRSYAAALAQKTAIGVFERSVYFRGIIEFTNYCKNDCLYCGIRRSNRGAHRYRLTSEEVLMCCREGYSAGFRTFVLQGGEDAYFNDERLCSLIRAIKTEYSDCAVTLSVGEKDRSSYQRYFEAGADRYLLRHETANEVHYGKLHPPELSLKHRLRCLRDLKEIGFQTGCGFMVGTPGQTDRHLAEDMLFITEFKPHMVGIGPFIPHADTPFCGMPAGNAEKTLFLLSLTRILQPEVLLPATTALGTVRGDGRQLGVLAGCNVIMPNLSPLSVRKKYMLYDNKIGTEVDARSGIALLTRQMTEIGYSVVIGRGDYQNLQEKHDD